MNVVKKNLKVFFHKLKKVFNIFIEFVIKNKSYFFMTLSFIAMDLMTRFLGREIDFYNITSISPNLFTISWIVLFLGITLSVKKSVGKWIYLGFNILFIAFFLINNIYYSMTSNFFGFNLLQSLNEGSPYLLDAIRNCSIIVYIFLVIIIILTFFGFKNIPNSEKFNYKKLCCFVLAFFVIHTVAVLLLGKANENLVWSTWKNPRNVYNLYNDNNKSMKISGLYEYTFRNFYVTFLKVEEKNQEDLEYLQEEYAKDIEKTTNKYTGKFKGKNLIFLQLEGIDNWVLNKQDTPTLYKMMSNSINFTDHYSFYNGGGSTFNSEFAVNTGFIVPFSYIQNAYAFNNNAFPFSMARLFKEKEYVVNAFHMNSGEYYSRSINYKNWGYNNYYGLIDMYNYDNYEYRLDRELILNEEFSSLMFPIDTSFVDYLITYSTHMPFTNVRGVCKQLFDLDNLPLEELSSEESSSEEIVLMTEEECIKRQAQETDYMVSLLLNKLKEQNLLNDVIIVAFADHYLYTVEDQTILEKYKETENNLINKTPFFIWDNGKTKTTIKKTTSQLNILPTVLNLFGMEYNSNYYIGEDALNNSYSGIVFFSDYSWYNGNVYVEGGEVTNNKRINEKTLEEKNYLISTLTKKNDLTLKYNYFKQIVNNN